MSSAAAAAAMASAAMAATTVDGLEVAGRNVEKMLHADSQFSGLQASCKNIFLPGTFTESVHLCKKHEYCDHKSSW